MTGQRVNYRGILKQFVAGEHCKTPMGIRDVARTWTGYDVAHRGYPVTADWNLSGLSSKELWLKKLARLVVSGNWSVYCDPQPPVSKTKAVSPRRGSSKEEKALSAFLAETLTLTAPSATPEDWLRVEASKPKATHKSPRKKVLKPGHFTG